MRRAFKLWDISGLALCITLALNFRTWSWLPWVHTDRKLAPTGMYSAGVTIGWGCGALDVAVWRLEER